MGGDLRNMLTKRGIYVVLGLTMVFAVYAGFFFFFFLSLECFKPKYIDLVFLLFVCENMAVCSEGHGAGTRSL